MKYVYPILLPSQYPNPLQNSPSAQPVGTFSPSHGTKIEEKESFRKLKIRKKKIKLHDIVGYKL